ncbi:MAG: cupin-like domain-containing protein [Gammaproteobacteria bacterium]|nr:cupin-like domain-containing protein [Gammaproteobacteria bacterium]
MPKQQLEIIEPITVEEFHTHYFLPRKPVIIRNYFKSAPIANITTMEHVATAFNDVDVTVIEEYVDRMRRKKKLGGEEIKCKLSQHLEHIRKNPQTKYCIREQKTPEEVRKYFTTPDYCNIRPDCELETNLFIANAGNVSRIHFDADHRSTFLYQVAGRKRVVLIPETESKKLAPMFNFSWLFLEAMSDNDREAFLDYTNAYEHILMPGEMLSFPMMMWHHLEYTDTGMSVNFRYGRSEVGDYMAKKIHPDVYSQNLAAQFHRHDTLSEEHLQAYEEIQAVAESSKYQPYEKYQQVREVCKKWYGRLCKTAIQQDYYASYEDDLIENIDYLNQCACYPYK